MNYTFHVQNDIEIDLVQKMTGNEVIFSTDSFSRWGILSLEKSLILNDYAKSKNIKTVFEIDRLFSETELTAFKNTELAFLIQFAAIRVRDVGVLLFLIEKFHDLKFQLIVESGHHNNLSLSIYQGPLFNQQVERLILSSELSIEELKEIKKEVHIPIEILTLGPILLFDTPRSLLSPLIDPSEKKERLEAVGKSEESPHKGFLVIENKFGTLMFHTKDICLLKYIVDLSSSGVDWCRIDTRLEKNPKTFSFLTDYWLSLSEERFENLATSWSRDWMRGFFHVNKTDVLFSKLKNSNTKREDSHYLGEVIDVIRDKAIVVMVRGQDLWVDKNLVIINPHGKEKEITLKNLKNSELESVEVIKKDTLAILPFVSGALARSQVYYKLEH